MLFSNRCRVRGGLEIVLGPLEAGLRDACMAFYPLPARFSWQGLGADVGTHMFARSYSRNMAVFVKHPSPGGLVMVVASFPWSS